MSEAAPFSRARTPENMPPLSNAVMRDAYRTLPAEEFRAEYAIPTPVDRHGLVDHDALVYQVSSFVEPDYKWKAPFFDEHHLYWPAASYEENDRYRYFRELPVHKIWVPRQFHNFTHLMTVPPEIPSVKVMNQEMRSYRRKDYLLQLTSRIITMQQFAERAQPYVFTDGGVEKVRYIDLVTRRVIDDLAQLDVHRDAFVRQLERHHKRGLVDLSKLSSLALDEVSIEETVPHVHANIMPKFHRAMGVAALKIELPFEKVA